MDSSSSPGSESAHVIDIAIEADQLLLKINKLTGGNPGSYIDEKDFYKEVKYEAQTKDKQRFINYLLRDYLFEFKEFLARKKTLPIRYKITPAGFEHIHKMLTTRIKSRKAFCAMWFDSCMDSIWTQAIKPAIEETKHSPIRIDEQHFTNDINAQMIMLIRQSKFLIADFTGDRGGVYFEAGFAYGLGLNVIFTCKEKNFNKESPHFDINHYPFILWDENDLPAFKEKLKDRIIITMPEE